MPIFNVLCFPKGWHDLENDGIPRIIRAATMNQAESRAHTSEIDVWFATEMWECGPGDVIAIELDMFDQACGYIEGMASPENRARIGDRDDIGLSLMRSWFGRSGCLQMCSPEFERRCDFLDGLLKMVPTSEPLQPQLPVFTAKCVVNELGDTVTRTLAAANEQDAIAALIQDGAKAVMICRMQQLSSPQVLVVETQLFLCVRKYINACDPLPETPEKLPKGWTAESVQGLCNALGRGWFGGRLPENLRAEYERRCDFVDRLMAQCPHPLADDFSEHSNPT